MCAKLGIDSHPHALRHYPGTELLSAGVDLRTVGGRSPPVRNDHPSGLRGVGQRVRRRAAEIPGSRMKRPRRST
jgi:hypothetical protein